MMAALQSLQLRFTGSQIHDLFIVADEDGDGVISPEEFARFASRFPTVIDALHSKYVDDTVTAEGQALLQEAQDLLNKEREKERALLDQAASAGGRLRSLSSSSQSASPLTKRPCNGVPLWRHSKHTWSSRSSLSWRRRSACGRPRKDCGGTSSRPHGAGWRASPLPPMNLSSRSTSAGRVQWVSSVGRCLFPRHARRPSSSHPRRTRCRTPQPPVVSPPCMIPSHLPRPHVVWKSAQRWRRQTSRPSPSSTVCGGRWWPSRRTGRLPWSSTSGVGLPSTCRRTTSAWPRTPTQHFQWGRTSKPWASASRRSSPPPLTSAVRVAAWWGTARGVFCVSSPPAPASTRSSPRTFTFSPPSHRRPSIAR
eukprot:Sspe_Gene.27211::Locus_11626_Transcript_1_10_Confidence_0.143_Length_2185::g.27211::m.27211